VRAQQVPCRLGRRRETLQQAEALFMDHGPLSCILLFCASLPECYVLPDLSDGAAPRRPAGATHRIPHPQHGGNDFPGDDERWPVRCDRGSGRAQMLKVRLIHATIRNLILRQRPSDAAAAFGDGRGAPSRCGARARRLLAAEPDACTPRCSPRGWDWARTACRATRRSWPIRLLTFSYVYLRGMRQLGLGLSMRDEEAFLHCWNVTASVLGVRDDAHGTHHGRPQPCSNCMQPAGGATMCRCPDPRPALGRALMQAMEQTIPIDWLKPFAPLMTRYLSGRRTAELVGIDEHVSGLSRVLFELVISTVRLIDTLARRIWPQFSLSRLITRVLGYRLVTRLLMDQTRPLKLPQQLLDNVDSMLDGWGHDRHAPDWMNHLEDRWTTPGSWRTGSSGA
jgi:hypothetical protein